MADGAVSAVRRKIRDEALRRLRGGPRTRRRNAELFATAARLGRLAADLSASAAWRDVQLTRAVTALQTAIAEELADDDRAVALTLGRRSWDEAPSPTWDALLTVARRAVPVEPDLAARLAGTMLAVRPDDPDARAVSHDALRAARRRGGDTWRERARQRSPQDPVASVLADLAAGNPRPAQDWDDVEDQLSRGVDLAVAVAPELRRAYLGEAGAPRAYVPTLRAAVARGISGGAPLRGLAPVLRTTEAGTAPTSSALDPDEIEVLDLSGLREYLAGRSVCLVANSAALLEHELGAEIDSYDVVVRFNSFALDAPRTGRRTDVHGTIHLHDYNWDVPVDVRLVFGGDPAAWSRNLGRYLRPGAQRFVGDDSLRWPRRTLLGPAQQEAIPVPTTGFNTVLLLDYLDVSTRIDLFGFDFHTGAPYRRTEAMDLPVAAAHSYDAERTWVADRTVGTAPGRISLR